VPLTPFPPKVLYAQQTEALCGISITGSHVYAAHLQHPAAKLPMRRAATVVSEPIQGNSSGMRTPVHGCMDGQIDRRGKGQLDGWTIRQTEGQLDRHMDRQQDS
jgi:hypothetical protein